MAEHFPDFQKKVDYISLDSVCLNKHVFYHPKDGIARNNGYDPADWAIRISDVMDVPAADVRPVVRGKWGLDPQCPVCGEDRYKGLDAEIWADWEPPFCPNCGADMRPDKNGQIGEKNRG